MKLSKDYQYIVLCEDAQMKAFILRFLMEHSINSHRIRFRNYPKGEGSGEAFVKTNYPLEMGFLRRNAFRKILLITCIDADWYSFKERMEQLDWALDKMGIEARDDKDLAMVWIPKREIETWIHYLRGEDVDEEMSFRHDGNLVSCRNEAKMMVKICQDPNAIEFDRTLPSLSDAVTEYGRACQLQYLKT